MAALLRQFCWLFWLVTLTCSAEEQYGPSFDCKRAKLEIEQDICSNDVLARADQFIHDCYQTLLRQSGDKKSGDKNKLIAEQRAWLQSRNHFRDNSLNQRFFNNEEFIAGGYDEIIQLYDAFGSRIAELFDQLPPSQQRQLREHYLRQMGFRNPPSNPVAKWIDQQERNYAFENLANDCGRVTWDVLRNDRGLAVVMKTYSNQCGGTSWSGTSLEVYCINHNQLTQVDASPLNNEFERVQAAQNPADQNDDQLIAFADRLSTNTLCGTTK